MAWTKTLLGVFGLAVAAGAADPVCSVALQACPKTLEGTTIQVPEDAVWLDPRLPFCPEQVQVQTGGTTAPPSIVFIIDNSGSMNSTDGNEQRFSVSRSLLDSIYKAAPATKVGVVVFSRRLHYDHRENAFFKQADLGDPAQHDSYIPLTALNTAYPGGRFGIDTLKALLENDASGNLVHATKLPAVRQPSDTRWLPENVRDGTDITLGFQAAKQALIGDNNAKDNQYFIFLSDGEPSGIDVVRQTMASEWIQAVNVPTTFTVFFTNSSTPPPQIQTMNTNIRNNGYSASNPKSNTWAINLQASQLLPLLSSSVLNPIFANKPATPVSASLVSGTTNANTTTLGAGHFIFPGKVPLAAGQTSVVLTYNYSYVDSGITKTHTASYTVRIQRVPNATPVATQAKIECQDGDIQLIHEGKVLNLVTADHENLQVRLILPGGETCTNCTVVVEPHANRAGKDRENVALTLVSGTTYGGQFGREAINTAAAPNDGKLTHLVADSIVVTWTNPANPLHVIRKAFPYSDVRTALDVRNHNTYSVTDNTTPLADRKQWVLVGSTTVKVQVENGTEADCCKLVGAITPQDSAKYVGIKVTASRSFSVDIKVYDNLGQYVNKISFSVSQAEFANLPREGTSGSNRSLRVLWDNRTEDGAFAGTGAYIFKTTVTLNKIPGIATDQVVRTDHRLVGVVRGD